MQTLVSPYIAYPEIAPLTEPSKASIPQSFQSSLSNWKILLPSEYLLYILNIKEKPPCKSAAFFATLLASFIFGNALFCATNLFLFNSCFFTLAVLLIFFFSESNIAFIEFF